MTKKYKNKTKFLSKTLVIFMCLLSLTSAFGILLGTKLVFAYTEQITSWSNLNFASNNNLSNVYSSPSGWTMGFTDVKATSGAINVDHFNDSFYIEDSSQITKSYSDADDHILMINSKTSTSTLPAAQYYTNSSSLKLDANSSYKLIVRTKVLPSAYGSIYVTGLNQTIGFEKINNNIAGEWSMFTFYITTGAKEENIKTELWLGSKVKNVSSGAVLFDNLEVAKIAENDITVEETAENALVSTPASVLDNKKYINLTTSEIAENINGSFEKAEGLDGWKSTSSMLEGSNYEIMDLTSASISAGKGIKTAIGTDNTKNNKNALVLYTTAINGAEDAVKANFGVKTPEIALGMYETYKVSANIKVVDLNGSAYFKFVENKVKNANGDEIEEITPASQSITISQTSGVAALNGYQTYSFYVKARSLYNTTYNLEFHLGSEDAKASGAMAIDNIRIDLISDADYQAATADSANVKVNLQDADGSYGITNATFNAVKKQETHLTYPLIPENWDYEVSDKNDVYFGVVNTNANEYEAHKAEFGGFVNPGNPEGFESTEVDTNNILIMHNYNNAYQSITSQKFNVAANKYYTLSFNYQLVARSAISEMLNVYVIDEDNNVLYANENIASQDGVWKNFAAHISTNSYSNDLKIVISLGTKDNMLKGLAYIDNVTLLEDTKMTAETYAELNADYVLDFHEGNFNLVKDNGTNVFEALRYEGKLEKGTEGSAGSILATGGIIDGKNTEDEFNIVNSPNNTNSLKYMMMVQTHGEATYSMTAKDVINLESGKYYKFTVYAKTVFGSNASASDKEYGAEFGLTGIDQKIANIVSNDAWKEYTIYVNCTEAKEVSLRFALVSANGETAGMVYFDNYSFQTVEAEEFNVAKLNNEKESNFLFVGDTNEKDSDSDNSSSNIDMQALWFVVPSLILAVALIFAIVTAVMKKVKIKKWEKRKVNAYDRENTVHRDVIRAKAEKARDVEVKKVKAQIAELEQTISAMEEKHQEQVKEARTNRAKGVTKAAEREFKQYAKVRTAYQNRIVALNKEIDNMNTPEYLLAVQHKIAVQTAKEERENKEKSYKSNKRK